MGMLIPKESKIVEVGDLTRVQLGGGSKILGRWNRRSQPKTQHGDLHTSVMLLVCNNTDRSVDEDRLCTSVAGNIIPK